MKKPTLSADPCVAQVNYLVINKEFNKNLVNLLGLFCFYSYGVIWFGNCQIN